MIIITHYICRILNLLRKHNVPYDLESLIEGSFEYADAMYRKFESKEDKTRPNVLVDYDDHQEN